VLLESDGSVEAGGCGVGFGCGVCAPRALSTFVIPVEVEGMSAGGAAGVCWVCRGCGVGVGCGVCALRAASE
jgi:hypothetical protein